MCMLCDLPCWRHAATCERRRVVFECIPAGWMIVRLDAGEAAFQDETRLASWEVVAVPNLPDENLQFHHFNQVMVP